MRALVLHILWASLSLGAREAFAGAGGELVRGAPEAFRPAAPATRTVDDEVARLMGGRVPGRVSKLDEKYSGRNGSKQCRTTVQALRARPVTRKPAMATDALIAKAVAAGVPRRQIEQTLGTYFANRDQIPNQSTISVIDFTRRSNEKRLFTINLQTGEVNKYYVANGQGSDPKRRGIASHFSNTDSTHASSLGCALAAGEFRSPSKGWSMMMHGFESTNSNMCERAMWMHSAWYVGGTPGASHGCPAVQENDRRKIFDQIGGGGLICSYKDGDYQEATKVYKSKGKKKKSKKRRGHHGRRR